MQTYSHFLMTAVAGDVLKKRNVEVRMRALVLGSFMPDVPLYLLGAGYIAWAFWLAPTLGLAPVPSEHIFGNTFDTLYFTNPFWMASHNTLRFQAPISYWDNRHGAQLFRPFERTLDVLCVVYLVWAWWQNRVRRNKQQTVNSETSSITNNP